jgi:hypothetical protein
MSLARTCPNCGYTQTYTTEAFAAAHHPRHSCAKQQRLAERRQRKAHRRYGPKCECRHASRHEHGTRAAYVHDICRCRACTAANTAESNREYRERSFGRWEPYVDAGPVRAHIQQLRRAGIGVVQIAKLAGLAPSTVRCVIYPRPGAQMPAERVRPGTARKILVIQIDETNLAERSLVDATGTRRRLRSLVAAGFTVPWLAAQLGRTPPNLRRTMRSARVTARTAREVRDLDDRLWDTEPPAATKTQQAASRAARAYAADRGWLRRLAWDDIDHDPDPEPDQLDSADDLDDLDDLDEIKVERVIAGDTSLRLTEAEEREVVRRLTERGRSIRVIAELLSTSTRTVSRRRAKIRAA